MRAASLVAAATFVILVAAGHASEVAPARDVSESTRPAGKADGGDSSASVADTKFSVQRGYYDEPFEVRIESETEGAVIFYTTDGSTPGPTAGTRYTGPITISTTTVLRALASKPGLRSSNVDTQTYLFLDDVIRQPAAPAGFPATWGPAPADYAMDARITGHPVFGPKMRAALTSRPVLSLSVDPAGFWGAESGIYANTKEGGRDWERDVSVELFGFPGGAPMQVDAGIRVQGGSSRNINRPKHNLRLVFRRAYGDGKLEFPLFGDSGVQRFDELVLRSGNGDSWIHPSATQRAEAQYIRDSFLRASHAAMGQPASQQSIAHLYINGLYWGVYHVVERPVDDFMAEHFGGEKEEYDVIQHRNRTVDGDREAWEEVMRLVRIGGLEADDSYQRVCRFIDPENLIDFMLVNYYAGNLDWDLNNWYGGRRRRPGETWKFFTWDGERTLLKLDDDVTGRIEPNQPSEIHNALMKNPAYASLFSERVKKHFSNGGALTPEVSEARWLALAEEIEAALVAESARWGDHHRPAEAYDPNEEWAAETRYLLTTWFPTRTQTVFEQLRGRGWLAELDARDFEGKARGGFTRLRPDRSIHQVPVVEVVGEDRLEEAERQRDRQEDGAPPG